MDVTALELPEHPNFIPSSALTSSDKPNLLCPSILATYDMMPKLILLKYQDRKTQTRILVKKKS